MNNQYLKGKQIVVAGGNVVNNIKELYPDLFASNSTFTSVEIKFPQEIKISFVSMSGSETDYDTIGAGNILSLSDIAIVNIKIKSTYQQTGYIYGAGV